MRLSEAILMGRNLVKPIQAPTEEDEAKGFGCALTMAARAVGLQSHHDACRFWPWAASSSYWDITGRFDLEVMCGFITLEQLADYVRSIEPAEEAEKLPEPTGYVGEDGGYIPDWRDEEPQSVSLTAMEREKGLK